MASAASSSPASALAFVTNLTQDVHIRTLQYMTNLVIDQQSSISNSDLHQLLADDIQHHVDRLCTAADIRELIRRAEKIYSNISKREEYENSIRQQVQQLEQDITNNRNTRKQAQKIRLQNKNLYDTEKALVQHQHSPFVLAQYSFVQSLHQMKSRILENKRRADQELKEEKERAKKAKIEQKDQEKTRKQQEKEETKRKAKEEKEAKLEAEKENLRTSNTTTAMLAKVKKLDKQKQAEEDTLLKRDLMRTALRVLRTYDQPAAVSSSVSAITASTEENDDEEQREEDDEEDDDSQAGFFP